VNLDALLACAAQLLTDCCQAGIPLAYLFAETPEERAELAKIVKPVAEKQKGVINFATIDAKSFGAHAGNLNLEVGKWPAFAIQDIANNKKFPFDQEKEISEKDVDSFVADVISGKIQPSIKSEPVPESNDGPVSVVVAHSYKDIVLDDDKDVLLEFYAPWCGHCKALAPKYEELGQMYKDNADWASKVVIAKVDATANDVPDEIQGFPTIKLFPAGSKDSPVDYSGDRTIDDLVQFIADNGKHGVNANSSKKAADDEEMEDAEDLGEAAKAATEGAAESVKSAVSGAAEAVKTAVADSDEDVHDEL
jgi:protein disulfide-isomerase A1